MAKSNGPTAILADFVVGLQYEDLPQEVVEKIKSLLYDYLGYTIYSMGEKPAEILLDVTRELDGPGVLKEATVIGYGYRTNAIQASLVNGAMGHMTELDDTHRGTGSHPGDSVIAAGLAMAEKLGSTGKELITALVCGYEVSIRAGRSVMPSHYHLGWHPTGTQNTFGAAAVADKLLGLNVLEMRQAIGLAGAMTCGNIAHISERGMAKDFNPGRAAASGVYAAMLARHGLTGSTNFFEDERGGFCRLYARSSNILELTDQLGEKFKVMEVAHKPYTSCRHTHCAIDAALYLVEKQGIKPEEIESLRVRINTTSASFVDDKEPWLPEKGEYGPRFSAQFNVAIAILEGNAGLKKLLNKEYVLAKLNDERVRSLIAKIGDIVWDKDIDDYPKTRATIVEIGTPRGTFSHRVDFPKGEPEFPVTPEELEEKFTELATFAGLSASKQKTSADLVFKLETLPNIQQLMESVVV